MALSYYAIPIFMLSGDGFVPRAPTAPDLPSNVLGKQETYRPATEAPTKFEIKVVAKDGNWVHMAVEGAAGEIEVIAEMTKEADMLVLRGLHIQGQGAGTSSLSELRAIARQLGKEHGVDEVIIHGYQRAPGSGANPGKTPIPIRIKVD